MDVHRRGTSTAEFDGGHHRGRMRTRVDEADMGLFHRPDSLSRVFRIEV